LNLFGVDRMTPPLLHPTRRGDACPFPRLRNPVIAEARQGGGRCERLALRAAALLKEHGEIVRAIATSLLTIPPYEVHAVLRLVAGVDDDGIAGVDDGEQPDDEEGE
jgi:hypothetical protein